MNLPQVTVLTAVRNGSPFLADTIASIQAQTFADWEYILVDDCSDDNTVEMIENSQRKDSRIKLIRRVHSAGPYVAANDGLRAALGRYIVRIDADDLCPPFRIERQLQFLKDHPEFRACVSYWQGFSDLGLIRGTITAIPSNPRVFRWALLLRGPSIHSTACFELSLINEIGGYCELPLSQDYRLWCELSRRDCLGTIPEVLSYVRYHPSRQSHRNTTLQQNLALDVLGDHLFALTGERWSRQELESLRAVGLSLPISVDAGTEMLNRWDRLWQAAQDLTAEDREELAYLSALRRWKHLRCNARHQPIRVLVGLFSLATKNYRFLVPSQKGRFA